MSRLHSSPLATAAADYARRGFSVFPVRPRGKAPRTTHGHLDATTDPNRIHRWWEACPAANVGLAISSGLVVVDLDEPAALLRLRAEDRELPATARSVTGRGFHLFYRTAVEIRNAVSLFPGVDLRGIGGYVVVPPSVHPSGTHYRWEVPLTESSVAEAPAWLLEAALERSTPRAHPPEEWRALVSQGVTEGGRNNAIAKLAGHLLRRDVDPWVVLGLLLCWNGTRCRPPLTEDKITRTVDSIAGRELRRRVGRA